MKLRCGMNMGHLPSEKINETLTVRKAAEVRSPGAGG